MVKNGAFSARVGLLVDGHPEIRRTVGDSVTKKGRRRNSDDSKRMGLDGNGRADNGRIPAELILPRAEAEYHDGGRCRLVIGLAQHPPLIRTNAKGGKIISCDKLAP